MSYNYQDFKYHTLQKQVGQVKTIKTGSANEEKTVRFEVPVVSTPDSYLVKIEFLNEVNSKWFNNCLFSISNNKKEAFHIHLLFSHYVVSDSFVTPWTVAHQVPSSKGFTGQEYWSGLPFLSPGVISTRMI